jgi:hypothetical protein
MGLKFNLIMNFNVIAMGVIVLSGCAMVDQTTKETDSGGMDTSFDGTWIIEVAKFRREQLGPAMPPYGHTRWSCGDGKPFQLELDVINGSVHVLNGKPVEIGKVSGSAKFKSVYSREAESIDIYTGSFKKKVGKIQNRTKGLNGCHYGFELVKK